MARGCADFNPTLSQAQLWHSRVRKESSLHSSRELLSLCALDLSEIYELKSTKPALLEI